MFIPGSNGTLCRSDSSTPSFKRHSVVANVESNVTSSPSSATFSNPSSPFCHNTSADAAQASLVSKNKMDSPTNGSHLPSRPNLNSARQLFNKEAKHYGHRSLASPSSPNSFVAHQKSSLLLPSYNQLLSMKQNEPSRGHPPDPPRFSRSKPHGSIPSSADLQTSGGVRLHSKCCCCSVCFQSSYHYHHHHHHYLPQNNASTSYNGSRNGKAVSFASPEISMPQQQHFPQQQHVPSCFSHGFLSQNHSHEHRRHSDEPLIATNHVVLRSCDHLWQTPNALMDVPAYYQPCERNVYDT